MMRGEGEVWHWRIFNFFFFGRNVEKEKGENGEK